MQGFSRNLIVVVLMALLVFALVGCSTTLKVQPISPIPVAIAPVPVMEPMPIPGPAEPIPPVPAP